MVFNLNRKNHKNLCENCKKYGLESDDDMMMKFLPMFMVPWFVLMVKVGLNVQIVHFGL